MTTPDKLYQQHKSSICDAISQFPLDTSDGTIDQWVKNVRDHLCADKDGGFTMEFGYLLHKEVQRMVKVDRAMRPVNEISDSTPKPDEDFNPIEWVTVKVYREHYKGVKKALNRYNGYLKTPLIFKAVDP